MKVYVLSLSIYSNAYEQYVGELPIMIFSSEEKANKYVEELEAKIKKRKDNLRNMDYACMACDHFSVDHCRNCKYGTEDYEGKLYIERDFGNTTKLEIDCNLDTPDEIESIIQEVEIR